MLVQNNVTSTYQCTNESTVKEINDEANMILKDNNISGKIPKYELSNAFVSIKDHKKGFPGTVKCRLLNPSKTHIGKLSKSLLQNIISRVRNSTVCIQWKNSTEVVSWFDSVTNKKNKCFVCFDIVDYYPSIKRQQLLNLY